MIAGAPTWKDSAMLQWRLMSASSTVHLPGVHLETQG
jgi:hypothetical protein